MTSEDVQALLEIVDAEFIAWTGKATMFDSYRSALKRAIARYAARSQAEAVNVEAVGCEDCGRPYGDANGFPDLIIPKDSWHQISPSGDDGGLLCPSCICKRLHDRGIRCEGAFMSGPVQSIPEWAMYTMRWMENLREQGHGWSCPDCDAGRDKESAHQEPRESAQPGE